MSVRLCDSIITRSRGNMFSLLRTKSLFSKENPLRKRTREAASLLVHHTPLKKSHHRKRYSYHCNRTIARKLSDCDLMIHENPISPNFQINLVKHPEIVDGIGDHAYRRVQLFYYLCVAYHKSKCKIWKGRTNTQHGSGQHPWSQGAHSSILPHVVDDFFERAKKHLLRRGMNSKLRMTLQAVGARVNPEMEEEMGFTQMEIDRMLAEVDHENGLINRRKAFFHTLNSTVEVPASVNQFDNVIEAHLRSRALDILNEVSKGMHPYKGLERFVNELQSFLEKCVNEIKVKINSLCTMTQTIEELWILERNFSDERLHEYVLKIQELGMHYANFSREESYYPAVKVHHQLPWHKNYFLISRSPSKKTARKILKKIYTEKWTPETFSEQITTLTLSLNILHKQLKSSVMPEERMLSGKLENGRRVELTSEELWEQKLEILST